jgi:predicted amidophosphoribosyltransferase
MSRNDGEKRTLRKMIALYCRGTHGTAGELCEACRALLAYAEQRLDRCPHDPKPACNACRTHCYAPDQRRAIQAVMRYAGPRMLFHDPAGALRHLFRQRPPKRGKKP